MIGRFVRKQNNFCPVKRVNKRVKVSETIGGNGLQTGAGCFSSSPIIKISEVHREVKILHAKTK